VGINKKKWGPREKRLLSKNLSINQNNKVRVLSTELRAAQMGAFAAATNAQKAQ